MEREDTQDQIQALEAQGHDLLGILKAVVVGLSDNVDYLAETRVDSEELSKAGANVQTQLDAAVNAVEQHLNLALSLGKRERCSGCKTPIAWVGRWVSNISTLNDQCSLGGTHWVQPGITDAEAAKIAKMGENPFRS